MSTSDWLMILAVLIAPIAAVQAQKFLERGREKRNRKVALFQALMATRNARVSLEHVRALNMIDIEFYEHRNIAGISWKLQPDKNVREVWKAYHDHLNVGYDEDQFKVWSDKGDEFFTNLLHAIALALNYDFDKVLLKRGAYSPVAHATEERFQQLLKAGFLGILSGKQAISVKPFVESDSSET